ncbi:Hydrogenase isoenzymes formation protein HypE [Caloramator mitchellensis]|uniref:Hydrogenase isoenzymes formation protein HypE n=1 Tax=Caloramator mitchellensis TaxID=908809 RepID=A0A0R3JZV5_CALMK|nr:AIR synthase family protein [Caloramator mitchellensis]KRQ86149.1 Hydrogenase isoenzymes formation protein HypE [Caloramator mitchellensis]
MDIGKLPNEVLHESILKNIKRINEEVYILPSIGEDCGAIRFDEDVCVVTTDPITAATKNVGRLGVIINTNDIASSGVRPIGITVTLLAPPDSKIEDIESIMTEVINTSKELGVDILGGHTEITDAVNRIVLSITAIGKGKINQFVTTSGAKVGDDIVMTGYAGLEGTYILANEYYSKLKDIVGENTLVKFLNSSPDLSVLKAGLIAGKFGVHSMHDATEGGIFGAVWEVAKASKMGVKIYKEQIPILDETIKICNALNLNPYKLISSGSMIITTQDGIKLCDALSKEGIEAKIIGKITEKGCIVVENGIETEIQQPQSDEIYKVNF